MRFTTVLTDRNNNSEITDLRKASRKFRVENSNKGGCRTATLFSRVLSANLLHQDDSKFAFQATTCSKPPQWITALRSKGRYLTFLLTDQKHLPTDLQGFVAKIELSVQKKLLKESQ